MERAPHPSRLERARQADRGQSLVEFTLVIPFVLFLLLAVADFGRYYAAGITAESAARAAAEAVAADYAKSPPGALSSPAPTPGDPSYYNGLHQVASNVVCAEMGSLPNAGGPSCPSIPVEVCVHDGADPICDTEPDGRSIDSECTQMADPPTNTQQGASEPSRYAEVRVCYRFSTILNASGLPSVAGMLPVLNGDFFIQSGRMFTIVDY